LGMRVEPPTRLCRRRGKVSDSVGRRDDENVHNVVNLLLLEVGVLENLLDGLHGLAEEVEVELLELGAGEGLGKVLSLEEGLDLDLDRHLAGKSTLGLLDLALELAHGAEVLGDVLAVVLALPGLDEVVDDAVVEVLSSKVGVSSGRKNLEDSVVDREERDIKGSSSEVVDDDVALASGLVESVGDGGGGGLVNDTEDVESSDRSGILSGLALSVVEAGEEKRRRLARTVFRFKVRARRVILTRRGR
jgi:hypothetical protein